MERYNSTQGIHYIPTGGLLDVRNGEAHNVGCLLEIIHQLFNPRRHHDTTLDNAFEGIDEEYLEFLKARLAKGLRSVQAELASRRLTDPRI